MANYVTMEYKEPIEIEVNIYDVRVDGEDIDFDAEVDHDGDIRIELDENSFEEIAIKYLRDRNTDDELKDMLGIGEE